MKKIKVTKSDRKNLQKFMIATIILNLLVLIIAFATNLLHINKTLGIIFTSLIGIANLVCIILVGVFIKTNDSTTKQVEKMGMKYDPIFTQFIVEKDISVSKNLVMAEIMDLERRGHIVIEKVSENDCEIRWKDGQTFERMNDTELLSANNQKGDIKLYENIFITKIVFAFENKLLLSEINTKIQNGFYNGRLEICKFAMEKMLINEAEKKGLMIEGIKNKVFLLMLILNILISMITMAVMFSYNIFLMLVMVFNVAINGILLINEKSLEYQFTDDCEQYVEDLSLYMNSLRNYDVENVEGEIGEGETENLEELEILKILFGIEEYRV